MKKGLVFILLLIIAAGTFFPCCEIDDCPADRISSNTTNHDNKKEGNCSPFFACATCQGFAELAKPIRLTGPIIEKIVHHQTIVKLNLPTYFSSFWQPPRSC
jgi:hypothetical protein